MTHQTGTDTYQTCPIASKKSNMKSNINDLLRPGRIVKSVDYQKIVTKMEIECIEYLISSRACWLRITVVRPHFCFVQWVLGVFYMQKIILVAFCVEILTQSPFLSVLVYTKTKLIQSTNTISQEIKGSCVHITHVYITPIIQ